MGRFVGQPQAGERILLRIATRFNWRVASAMLGIAVCATYATGALALLDGLEVGSHSVLDRLDSGPYFAYRGTFPQLEPFVMDADSQSPYRPGWLRSADLTAGTSSVPVRVLAFSDKSPGDPTPIPGTGFVSPLLSRTPGLNGVLVIRTEHGVVEVAVAASGGPAPSLPETWILLSEMDLRRLATWEEGSYDLVLVEQREDAAELANAGYAVLALASAPEFFGAALQEARRLVGGLVAVSAVAIAAVAYSLLSLEIRYRDPETRTMLALGMDGRGVGRMYALQLAFIVVAGTSLGVAGGIVAANGLVSFAPLLGLPTVIAPHLSLTGLLVPLGAALGGGLAGGGLSLFRNVRRWDRALRR